MWQDTFNFALSFGTLLLQVAIIASIAALYLSPNSKFAELLKKHAFLLAFVLAIAGIALSLFYSKVIGYEPCELCWYLRVFLYPLAVVFGAELVHKEKGHSLWWSATILSGLGLLLSVYQYVAVKFFPGSLICDSGSVSCAKNYFTYFGYITIPMMALTSFLAIFLLLLLERRHEKYSA